MSPSKKWIAITLGLLVTVWYFNKTIPVGDPLYEGVATSDTTAAKFIAPIQTTNEVASWSLPAFIQQFTQAHPNQTGAYILENGIEALLARAWLADHATRSIEVQYFIWSNDNIGILASESLLRAADRGVKVRVIVDDLLINTADKTLLALAKHPNVDIRIYNPKHTVGTTLAKRIWNIVTDFKSSNQRMHDKTFTVDGVVSITGGRNMASEYFNFHHEANFRDRDALILGKTVADIEHNFNQFWQSDLSVPVEKIFSEHRLMQDAVSASTQEIQTIYQQLHYYANQDENFDPQLKQAIRAIPETFDRIAKEMVWTKVSFIHDQPGKNQGQGLYGGGNSTKALADLVNNAKKEIVIQSPYLVLSDAAIALLQRTLDRGVRIIINTNSMAATDNLQAFSGYKNQREKLLKMGLIIYEFRPDAASKGKLLTSPVIDKFKPAVFSLHAKSMVIDREIAYIGTFNFDPRSENLNTEVGVIIYNEQLANTLATTILEDTEKNNSWDASKDNPDQYVGMTKKAWVWFYSLLPIQSIL
jgi:putative cardiolipin synthase